MKSKQKILSLPDGPINAINIGLSNLYESLQDQGLNVVNVNWHPPAGGDVKLLNILTQLKEDSIANRIDKANEKALDRIMRSDPVLEDVAMAIDVIPGMTEDMILHAGPPINWKDMSVAMQGAVIGALFFEDKVTTPEEAIAFVESGACVFSSAQDHDTAGAFTGILTASMPVCVVRNRTFNNVAFCGWRDLAQAAGSYAPEVIKTMKWLKNTAMPVISSAVKSCGGFELKPMLAQGLLMGDEHHIRTIADTSIFTRMLAPFLIGATKDVAKITEVLKYFAEVDVALTPVTIAASKSIIDAGHGIEASTIVTSIGRNGKVEAIRVSGLGNQWFDSPAPYIDGVYHSGFCQQDSAPAMGDSGITECAGFGGLAMAAAPALMTSNKPGAAEKQTMDMYSITLSKNSNYPIINLGFQGIPTGIDIRKVVETGIEPIGNGIAAHKDPKKFFGPIGAGIIRTPMEAFTNALTAFGEKYLSN